MRNRRVFFKHTAFSSIHPRLCSAKLSSTYAVTNIPRDIRATTLGIGTSEAADTIRVHAAVNWAGDAEDRRSPSSGVIVLYE